MDTLVVECIQQVHVHAEQSTICCKRMRHQGSALETETFLETSPPRRASRTQAADNTQHTVRP
jgi:hypothetical protein